MCRTLVRRDLHSRGVGPRRPLTAALGFDPETPSWWVDARALRAMLGLLVVVGPLPLEAGGEEDSVVENPYRLVALLTAVRGQHIDQVAG